MLRFGYQSVFVVASIVLFQVRTLAPVAVAASPTDSVSASDPGLSEFDLSDHRGRRWTLDDFNDKSLVVVAFLGVECPLAKLYSIRLNELADRYADRGVAVIGVMSNRQDSLAEIGSFASRQAVDFPLLKDGGNRLADQLGAERTPEMFVFDAKRRLRYRGRVDDQYGIGYVRDEPGRRDLKIAIDELLTGRDVSITRTAAIGCIIGRSKPLVENPTITYGSHVAKILNKHCVECHREGEISPFSLTDPDEVVGWADMIAEVVREERMPPWHATGEHASFANDRRMSDQDKQTLYDWADSGAPLGSLENLPELPAKVAKWQLPREPDHVFNVSPEPIDIPAEGVIRYQYFAVDPGFEKDVWIEAAELRPGNREVVHHILAFAVPKGQRRGLDAARGFLVGYVPGARLELAPDGHAKKVPAGSELVFQVHYTPTGYPQTDHSQLGILLADPNEITHEIVTTSAINASFRIPPGESDHSVTAVGPPFPENATLLSFSPHMHVRGKSYRYELQDLAGKREPILDIPAYDFNWQTTYVLSEPRPLTESGRMYCVATFDNSEDNLNNPDPTSEVRWGDQTWDEMMIGYYHYSVPLAKEAEPKSNDSLEDKIRRAVVLKKFDELDTDGDGKISRDQTPAKIHEAFDKLDANQDRVLTRQEAGR
ncbi:redoxin family protein [Rubripirellula reticaptiva]|uniref:Thiol-disulfide oxidoreductase n=1 Tax=Rubripirellula reticaptiva TaxID=2528013 RepID=A0A5C6FC44_9BACT|nr:redoxin family protein [Rubripirellula reticaptiva]TWU58187.1 thiol-disulfide oxidoreductase [Rubripirellula reticaptiva]